MLPSEMKMTVSSSLVFIITTLHYAQKRFQGEMRGCTTCQGEKEDYQKQAERVYREAQCVSGQIQEEQSFFFESSNK